MTLLCHLLIVFFSVCFKVPPSLWSQGSFNNWEIMPAPPGQCAGFPAHCHPFLSQLLASGLSFWTAFPWWKSTKIPPLCVWLPDSRRHLSCERCLHSTLFFWVRHILSPFCRVHSLFMGFCDIPFSEIATYLLAASLIKLYHDTCHTRSFNHLSILVLPPEKNSVAYSFFFPSSYTWWHQLILEEWMDY